MGDRGKPRIQYNRFEDLPVWRDAVDLAASVFGLSAAGDLRGHPGLKDQLERAALSVSNNIAEGYERGTHDELVAFLYYAKGSAGEVRSMLHVLGRSPIGLGLEPEVEKLLAQVLGISRQLGSWIESLKNSEHRGPRHNNAETRRVRSESIRRDTYLEELRRIVDAHRPASE